MKQCLEIGTHSRGKLTMTTPGFSVSRSQKELFQRRTRENRLVDIRVLSILADGWLTTLSRMSLELDAHLSKSTIIEVS